MVIVPTVGRIVWYHPADAKSTDQPLAAIVTHVWSNTSVSLAVFEADGRLRPNPLPPGKVLLVQEGTPLPSGGDFCEWMPYQLAQAKKQAETS